MVTLGFKKPVEFYLSVILYKVLSEISVFLKTIFGILYFLSNVKLDTLYKQQRELNVCVKLFTYPIFSMI